MRLTGSISVILAVVAAGGCVWWQTPSTCDESVGDVGFPAGGGIVDPVFPTERALSMIEVRDIGGRQPIAGAAVTVTGVATTGLGSVQSDDIPIALAPTNELGRTVLGVEAAYSLALSDVQIEATVDYGGQTETLAVPNVDEAVTEGVHFVVQVIDTDASPPDPPTLGVIEGTDPLTIQIGGYVEQLTVCSHSTGEVIWDIIGLYHPVYFESLVVGDLPAGFHLNSDMTLFCEPSPADVAGCPEGFTVSGTAFDLPIEPISYFIENGAGATICPDELE